MIIFSPIWIPNCEFLKFLIKRPIQRKIGKTQFLKNISRKSCHKNRCEQRNQEYYAPQFLVLLCKQKRQRDRNRTPHQSTKPNQNNFPYFNFNWIRANESKSRHSNRNPTNHSNSKNEKNRNENVGQNRPVNNYENRNKSQVQKSNRLAQIIRSFQQRVNIRICLLCYFFIRIICENCHKTKQRSQTRTMHKLCQIIWKKPENQHLTSFHSYSLFLFYIEGLQLFKKQRESKKRTKPSLSKQTQSKPTQTRTKKLACLPC